MELVFEIGCEDLPARFVNPLFEQLKSNFVDACINRNLLVDPENVYVTGTPRRLLLVVEGLAQKQADIDEERTGPPAAVAFRDGEPTKAAEGFARGQGKSVEDLYTVETEKGEYVAVKVFEEGATTASIIPEILSEIVNAFSFPKSMRWGANREQFGRPVRWLLALLDGQVVPVAFAGVHASNTTLGHRFAPAPGHELAPSVLTVTDGRSYFDQLKANSIVVDYHDRRARVAELVSTTAKEAGEPVNDTGLIDEVTNLVESPYAVLVRYDESYLELPDEVLISSMRKHQRYFGVVDGDQLTNACVVVYNTPVRDPAVVAAGNLRVLKARLDDAKFFWETDLKRPLDDYMDRLHDVLWLKKLGSMKAKSERISMLATRIAETLAFDQGTITAAGRAGLLCKCDLVTQMVYEFPDLQGIMGREYAKRSGEGDAVAKAIGEHYLPQGADDALPESNAGACVALAAKLDSLVGCFLIDMVPTSTADPYGLRRAAIGTIRILQDNGWTISLSRLTGLAEDVYDKLGDGPGYLSAEQRNALHEFLTGRLENQLTVDYPTDIVRAVLAVGVEDVTTVKDRVVALAETETKPTFGPLKEAFKRTRNILRKNPPTTEDIDDNLLEDSAERALREKVAEVAEDLPGWVEGREWKTALAALADYAEPLETFFDNVMVMADDEAVRGNRLAMLKHVEDQFLLVADLSVIS